MANVVNNLSVHDNDIVKHWISQIKAADGEIYDIATHHGITFKENGVETTWNGLSDLTVVIPTVTELLQSPITLVGTVDKDGKIHNEKEEIISDFSKGNLVYFAEDCLNFENKACEAGDMAIYDGEKWVVVSGENQVKITNYDDNKGVITINNESKSVLDVEGKTLSLSVNYDDITNYVGNKVSLIRETTRTTVETTAYIDPTYITVSSSAMPLTVGGESKTITQATRLSDGSVKFSTSTTRSSATDVEFVSGFSPANFTSGSLQTVVLNDSSRSFPVTGGSVSLTSGSDFVTGVSLSDVTFVSVSADSNTNKITVITSIDSNDTGRSFVTGVDSNILEPDFGFSGLIKTDTSDDNTFSVIVGESTPIAGVTPGEITLDNTGSHFITGLSTTEISGKTGNVITDVTVTQTSGTACVATVKGNVLEFTNVTVVNDINTTYKSKNFTTGQYTYTPASAVAGSFKKLYIKEDTVGYKFNTDNEKVYTPTVSYWALNTPEVNITRGSYIFNNSDMLTTVPEHTFVTGLSGGSLPSYEQGSATFGYLSGSVSTDLSFGTNLNITGLTSSIINVPTYHIVESNNADDGGVAVGKPGELSPQGYVDLSRFITDVKISSDSDTGTES